MEEWDNIEIKRGVADEALNNQQYDSKAQAAQALVSYRVVFGIDASTPKPWLASPILSRA